MGKEGFVSFARRCLRLESKPRKSFEEWAEEQEAERAAKEATEMKTIREDINDLLWTDGVIRGHIPRPKTSQEKVSEGGVTEQIQ